MEQNMDNILSDVYTPPDATSTVLSELSLMSLHSNDDCLPPDRESETDLADSVQNEPSHPSETRLQGDYLLKSFVNEQIYKEGLEVPSDETIDKDYGKKQEAHALGRDLRRLADAFEQSYERKEVKKKASTCNLDINSYSEFSRILKSLFTNGGITHSRIIVLFFFCSDFAIRTLKECSQRFARFISWFFQFLSDYVYEWVELHGGWFAVLNPTYYNKYIMLSTVVACMLAIGIYRWMKR
ncbi:apoptosis regulator BAX [Octopus vulgaris]|uniref:Apoptosis regulator BAX n=2 Tax=Octopus vulgaris TaxID=6645 RepID=A0AA36BI00_OCTVU|nr:apoptosis regulator BAX [Octopus vulgaris]